jgi:hypothetical protein
VQAELAVGGEGHRLAPPSPDIAILFVRDPAKAHIRQCRREWHAGFVFRERESSAGWAGRKSMLLAKSAARAVGVLLLAQMAASYLVNFVLLDPLTSAPGGLLVNAAASPLRVGTSALVGIGMGAISVGIAITVWPILSRYSSRLALWMVALAVISVSLLALQQIAILCVLSLSEMLNTAPDVSNGVYKTVALLARSIRNWAHYTELVIGGGMYFVFFAALFRFRLVPRPLAGFGLVAVVLQIGTVSAPFFGHDVIFPLLAPLGIAVLVLAIWLIVRGLSDVPVAGS